MTTANTAASLLDQCRLTLGRMHRGMVPLRTVRADARERLIADGLAVEQTTGYLEVTARGRGLAANPAAFIIEDAQAINPITISGWYPLTDGRWGFYAWIKGQPQLTQRADRPPTAEEEEAAAELEQAAKARRAEARLARVYE